MSRHLKERRPEQEPAGQEDAAASRHEPSMLALQRGAGNAAVARLLSPPRPTVQRFIEPEHKAIGDKAMGDVPVRSRRRARCTWTT